MTHPDGSRASMDRLEANNWRFMVMREHAYVATPNFLGRHPSLSPKIRYILIDWLIEVRHLVSLCFANKMLACPAGFRRVCPAP